MNQTRRNHAPSFKAKVGLKALAGEQTINEIAKEHEIHPVQVAQWRKSIVDGAPTLFERKGASANGAVQAREEDLLCELGRLQMEVAYFKKKLKSSL